jgi:hypothetical protein
MGSTLDGVLYGRMHYCLRKKAIPHPIKYVLLSLPLRAYPSSPENTKKGVQLRLKLRCCGVALVLAIEGR